MAKDDTKNLKDEIRPLKDILEIVKDKVDKMGMFLDVTMQSVRDIRDQQSVMNKKLDGVTERLDDSDIGLERINERLDANSSSLAVIEKEIKGYKDAYQINDSNIRKMERRLEIVEEDRGINVPPELQLVDVS